MDQMKRFAIYYVPEPGAFADAAASWLGWDLALGTPVPQPVPDLPRPLADITAEPRKYGFHATLKPPFRLADGVNLADLTWATARLATSLAPLELPGLQMVNLEGFLALTPAGDTSALQNLAAEVVRTLDPHRATLTSAETARRRPERLTPRQRDLLSIYGYPYVMDQFQFHLTLSGPLDEGETAVTKAAANHFAGLIPQPFHIREICLCGEDATGRFHLLHRYALSA
jgi:putative phosphonate metabolism protein